MKVKTRAKTMMTMLMSRERMKGTFHMIGGDCFHRSGLRRPDSAPSQ
jgi:hypothetical protein